MKLKNKILLGASALLILSGASAATGTFAWYNATRQATLALTNIGVKSELATLSIKIHPLADDNITEDTEITEEKKASQRQITSNKALTDVSGNGASTDGFIKPIFDFSGDSEIANIKGWWTKETYTKAYTNQEWYYKFTYDFSVDSQDVALYISPASSVTATTDNSGRAKDVEKSVRITALTGTINKGQGDGTKDTMTTPAVAQYIDISGDADPTYLTKAEQDGGSTRVESTQVRGNILNSTFFGSTKNNHIASELSQKSDDTNYYAKPAYGYLGDIKKPSGSSTESESRVLTVSFIVWIEGTDSKTLANSTGDDSTGFDLDLKFYTIQINDIPAENKA